jgi:hypothetical protein
MRVASCDLALTPFAIDAGNLVMLASEHFMLTRMMALPGVCRKGGRPTCGDCTQCT